MPTFKNLDDLGRYLEKNVIPDVLSKEVAAEVKDALQESVIEEVYNQPTSESYLRRGTSGFGLGDKRTMVSSLIDDSLLEVHSEARLNPFKKSDGSYYKNAFPKDGSLAKFVEYGTKGGIVSNKPRPFMAATHRELKNSGRLLKALKKGFERRGIKTKV